MLLVRVKVRMRVKVWLCRPGVRLVTKGWELRGSICAITGWAVVVDAWRFYSWCCLDYHVGERIVLILSRLSFPCV